MRLPSVPDFLFLMILSFTSSYFSQLEEAWLFSGSEWVDVKPQFSWLLLPYQQASSVETWQPSAEFLV